MASIRILVTGFGPFPGVAENPSAWLAERLVDRAGAEVDAVFHVRMLPTEWGITKLMDGLYETLQPHVMIHFGLSARAKGFRIERSAHNRTAPRADAAGTLPLGLAICPTGPDCHHTTLPVRALASHLRDRGFPAAVSRSAGSYLCNYLYYNSLDWSRRQANASHVLFVHIPPVNALAEEALLLGARETLHFVLDAFLKKTNTLIRVRQGFARREPSLRAKEA